MVGWNSLDSRTYEEGLAKREYKGGLKHQQYNKANTATTKNTRKAKQLF